jgi:hypothetical protein
MQTYEGTKFILWQSLLKHQPAVRLEQVEDMVPDMVAALNIVLGLSGITVDEEDSENPTKAESAPTPPIGAS